MDKYCLDNDHNTVSPVHMFKYLLLKAVFALSDVNVVERYKYDMAFKYFLDMASEEVINASFLTKFRKICLKDMELLDMLISKNVAIAVEKGVLKSKSIIVDATHTKSRYNSKTPQAALQEQAKKLRKTIYEIEEPMKEKFPKKNTEDSLEKEMYYCQKLIDIMETDEIQTSCPKIMEKTNLLKEVVQDDLEHLQTSLDADAKIGHKTSDTSFFGYKTHIAMAEERIVTEENRTKENKFEFNNDAGMYSYKAGYLATRNERDSRKSSSKNPRVRYYFEIQKCKHYSYREGCYKEGTKSKSYSETIICDTNSDHAKFQETEYFKEKAKDHYKIEGKNSELKNRHGYDAGTSSC